MKAGLEAALHWLGRMAAWSALGALLVDCTLDRTPSGASDTRDVAGDRSDSGGAGSAASGGAGGASGSDAGDAGAGGAAGMGTGGMGGTGDSGAAGNDADAAIQDAGPHLDGSVSPGATCAPGSGTICDCANGVCPACPSGGCTYYCFTGACSARCPTGDCDFLCSPSANCTLDCDGDVLRCPLCTSPAPCPLSCGQPTAPALIGCFG